MELIILAGGYGTRLGELVKDVPKPMLEVNRKPFLWYLLNNYTSYGVEKIIICVKYKAEIIIDFFKYEYNNIPIEYVFDDKKVGTCGVIAKALELVNADIVIITNGDTYCEVDLNDFADMENDKSIMSVIVQNQKSASKKYERYDKFYEINNNIIVSKEMLKDHKNYLVNLGIYGIKKDKIKNILPFLYRNSTESFEIIFKYLLSKKENIVFYNKVHYAIDIGVKNDYELFIKEKGSFC